MTRIKQTGGSPRCRPVAEQPAGASVSGGCQIRRQIETLFQSRDPKGGVNPSMQARFALLGHGGRRGESQHFSS
ncbi:hypothetical protein J7355_02715 [Endozoicomonas sp. G2_2]|uniref:hypothetical protein n=1 Tax=Endozoicomonas sp. G2_2 TaxID=2821092 RepID=UPI001ADB3920|nr:hypothetical protein [Endozoicomonas sp. G2_2]MBO9469006.1 hypothetical protein [Endozoicomonas sp. G2_2]